MAAESDIDAVSCSKIRRIAVVLYIHYYLLWCHHVIASYLFTLLSLYVKILLMLCSSALYLYHQQFLVAALY